VQTLLDQRSSYMQAEALRVETLAGKSDQTAEDQQALARYRDQLNRYNELISLERGRCAAAGTQETGTTNAED
jgi:lipid II:glycine glycyltransferase (peptidoglycan interpeptide bridge formation enzyme)